MGPPDHDHPKGQGQRQLADDLGGRLPSLHGEDTRFAGGFAIYDAPEPWGPWTVAFRADQWDIGPGESMHLPTKWMSADGREIWLAFSGDDSFSLRRGTLLLSQ